MKKLITLLAILLVVVMNGCATNQELIRTAGVGTRSGVFQELSDGGSAPMGYADLLIVSSLKTHVPELYPLEKKSHGTSDYKLVVNIDGQAITVTANIRKETIETTAFRHPEEGVGIRYSFRKALRLNPGSHRIVIALPEDGIVAEKEITLKKGVRNCLSLEPLYRARAGKQRPGSYGLTSFMEGLRDFRITLNGETL